ncbi:MAG: LVIVD repeat-containing protein [Myxococcaceae bacterium]
MRITLVVVAVAVLSGCGSKAKDPGPAECGSLPDFGLQLCQPASLSQVQAEGIWNMQVRLDGFEPFADVFSLQSGNEQLFANPLSDKDIGSDHFYLSTTFNRTDGRTVKWGFAGCTASSPAQVEGKVTACVNGQRSAVGTFTAKRIQRPADEQEASGLTLVSEQKVAEGVAVDVTVSGNAAYVASLTGGVSVFDITDRSQPVVMTHLPADGGYWNDVAVNNNTLYVATAEQGVLAFDVTNPAKPVRGNSLPLDLPNVHTVLLDGTRLYAMSPDPIGETIIFDAANPTLQELGRFRASSTDPSTNHFPHDACVLDNRLYVNHWASGVVVADVTNPANPTQLVQIDSAHKTSHACAVGHFGQNTYLYEGGEDWGASLRVFDVTNIQKPSGIVTQVDRRPEISIHNMQLVGNKLYVAWYQDGLRVFDVTSPTKPTQIEYFNTWRESDPGRGSSFYDGTVGINVPGDGFIYVAEASRGLMIFKEP